jgi:outer membrane biosynthesis protein TonB
MADERDPKVSRSYRELGAEEPSRELDAAILAASRRAVEARPAPLVAPAGRRRWYVPLAAAAIITLAVAVTVQVERQRPATDAESTSAPPVAANSLPAPSPAPAEAPPPPPPQAVHRRDAFVAEPPKPESAPVPRAAPVPQAAPREEQSRAAAEQARAADLASAGKRSAANTQGAVSAYSAPRAAAAPAPAARMRSEAVASGALLGQVASPEQALQGIADLRRQGRDDEADRALAEFRKRFPYYRIPPEMLEKADRK